MRARLTLEAFENRIVPAAVVKFTQLDEGVVTVKTSKGTTAQLELALGVENGATLVQGLNLNLIANQGLAEVFAGTNITITAKGGGTRNLADFVAIDAYNSGDANSIDLGKVSVQGNLLRISAGDFDANTPAIAKLTVSNWQPFPGADSAPDSKICGNIGAIVVKGDFNGFLRSVDAAGNANFTTGEGTVIGSFKAKNIASGIGDDVGRVQVRGVDRLVVTDNFYGNADPAKENGLIEAEYLGKIAIERMSLDARIVLA